MLVSPVRRMLIGVAAWVVGLVVVRAAVWLVAGREAGRFGFVVAQAGSGGDEVEDLHDLGAETSGESRPAAEGVLARDPALFVGGGAQR